MIRPSDYKLKSTVAVCIPTYNVGNYLDKLLRSLENQTFKDFVIYILDDGSSDDTEEIIDKYKGVFHISYVYSSGIHNIGTVKNKVVKMALKGDHKYIQMIDSDDLVEPTFLEEMVKKLEEGFDYVVCDGIMFGESSGPIHNTVPTKESILEGNSLVSWGMFKREVLQESNYRLALKHFEDWDLYIRLVLADYKCGVVDKPLYNYRMHAGQFHRVTNKDFDKHKRNIMELNNISTF